MTPTTFAQCVSFIFNFWTASNNILFNDIWKSKDGAKTWELITNNPGFEPRDAFAFGVLEPCFGIPPSICQDHGAIILAGGNTKVDGSIDGITEEVRSKLKNWECSKLCHYTSCNYRYSDYFDLIFLLMSFIES